MEIVKNVIVEDKIFTIRSMQVMIDKDLAKLYEVETKRVPSKKVWVTYHLNLPKFTIN